MKEQDYNEPDHYCGNRSEEYKALREEFEWQYSHNQEYDYEDYEYRECMSLNEYHALYQKLEAEAYERLDNPYKVAELRLEALEAKAKGNYKKLMEVGLNDLDDKFFEQKRALKGTLQEKDYTGYFKALNAFKEKYRNVKILNRDDFEYTIMRPHTGEHDLFTKDEWSVFKEYYQELSEIETRIDNPIPPTIYRMMRIDDGELDSLHEKIEIELLQKIVKEERLMSKNIVKEETDDEVLLRMLESGAISFSAKAVTEADQEYYSARYQNIKDELCDKKDNESLKLKDGLKEDKNDEKQKIDNKPKFKFKL